jgi:hypothetical protein
MVFVEGDDYRALRRPGDDPAAFRAPVRFGAVSSSPDPITDGLVAWYRFEDSSNTAIDYTDDLGVGADQTAFDGAVTGASFQSSGGVRDVVSSQNPSGAYRFDGVDDKITTGAQPLQTTNFTLMAVVKPNTTSQTQFIAGQEDFNDDNSFSRRYSIVIPGGAGTIRTQTNTSDGFVINDVASATTDKQHVALTYDGSQNRTVLNGTTSASVSDPGDCITGYQFTIGQPTGPDSQTTDGIIDDVRLYNRVVPDSELQQIVQNIGL